MALKYQGQQCELNNWNYAEISGATSWSKQLKLRWNIRGNNFSNKLLSYTEISGATMWSKQQKLRWNIRSNKLKKKTEITLKYRGQQFQQQTFKLHWNIRSNNVKQTAEMTYWHRSEFSKRETTNKRQLRTKNLPTFAQNKCSLCALLRWLSETDAAATTAALLLIL